MVKHSRYFDNHYIQDTHDFLRLRTRVYNHPEELVDIFVNRAVKLLLACSENSMRLLSLTCGPPTHSRDLRRLGCKLYNGELAGFGFALDRTARALSIIKSELAPNAMLASTIKLIGEIQCRFHVNERDIKPKDNWAVPDSDEPGPMVQITTINQATNHLEALAIKVMKLCVGACDQETSDRTESELLPILKTFLESDLGSRSLLHRLMQPAYEERPSRIISHPFESEFRSAIKTAMKLAIAPDGDAYDDLLYGRTGVLYTALYLSKRCHEYSFDRDASDLARRILASGAKLARHRESRFPVFYEWHGNDYLGAAHGLVGVLYMLLQVETRDSELQRQIESVALQSAELLVGSLQLRSGNFPTRLGRRDDADNLVQWCHGSPGAIALLDRLRQMDSDLKQPLTSAIQRAQDDIWVRGLLTKGVGLCHGIAGNGYAFLRDPDPGIDRKLLLVRAVAFAEVAWAKIDDLFAVPDNPFSLYEGVAGFVCYLLDCCLALCGRPILGIPGYDL